MKCPHCDPFMNINDHLLSWQMVISGGPYTCWQVLATQLKWVNMTPFGNPVVPELYGKAHKSFITSISTFESSALSLPVLMTSSRVIHPFTETWQKITWNWIGYGTHCNVVIGFPLIRPLILLHTVWKFHDFSITQNLREIKFGESKNAKSVISKTFRVSEL